MKLKDIESSDLFIELTRQSLQDCFITESVAGKPIVSYQAQQKQPTKKTSVNLR